MPKANDRIGPYQLINKLGAGGVGEVWLAQDLSGSSPREVAVKTPLNPEIDLDALLQEATLWARATGHLNVLEFLAARVFDGQIVLVSEYAPDGSLKDWLGRHGGRAPSVDAAVEMALGILAGLEHLHARSIIHRDIKPENVLLQGATPRLADFGISRVFKSTSKSAIAAGTPVYMAPEAFNRKRNQQTDLWSIGVMLYQMLSGRLPFEGNDMAELYGAILNEEPAPLPGAVPEWLRQVVSKTLTKEPEQRYQSAQEMREALRKLERDRQAEIAKRERREAERLRLEEEARHHEIERRRQIEEAARMQALREEIRRQEEEMANLKRALPHEAVTIPILRQPDEAATEPIIRRPDADKRWIDQEKEGKRLGEGGRWQESQRLLLIAGVALAIVIVAAYLLWLRQTTLERQAQTTPSPAPVIESSPNQPEAENVEALRYAIEVFGQKTRFTSHDVASGKDFKLHFMPRESGYLYLLAPQEEGGNLVPRLFAQPVSAGEDFDYPRGDNWLVPDPKTKQGVITIVFATEPITLLDFLSPAARAKRPLTGVEQQTFQDFRKKATQSGSQQTNSSGTNPAVVVSVVRNGQPMVFDIAFRGNRGDG